MVKICTLCKKEFTSYCHPGDLIFCPDCIKNRSGEVNRLKKENNRNKQLEKKKYWEDHPEEYKKFLADRKSKRDATKIKKYGSLENAEKARQQKQLATLKEQYPNEDWSTITNIAQLSAIKKSIKAAARSKDESFYKERSKKAKKTKIEKYGSLEKAYSTMQENLKKTNLERYGVESYSKTEQSKQRHREIFAKFTEEDWAEREEKTKKTKIEKYGSLEEAYKVMQENLKKTNLERYNVENASALESVIEKQKQTCLERYGVESYAQTEECQERIKQTCLKRYGVEHYSQTKECQEKRKQTCSEKYNVESYTQTVEFKKKSLKTLQEHYGEDITNVSQRGDHKEIIQKAISRDVSNFEKENNCTHLNTLVQKYGQGWLSLNLPRLTFKRYHFISNEYLSQIEDYFKLGNTRVSHAEKDLLTFIRSIYFGDIIENSRLIINPLELDIYIPEKQLAIEFNGDFWHSTDSVEIDYHENKSKLCEEKGIRLIHIYECEWKHDQEKIQSLLREALNINCHTIDVDQCEVRKISNEEAKFFNDKNHLQKHKDALVTYGLFCHSELQQLLSFSQIDPAKNLENNAEWEIIRNCTIINSQVKGGMLKLFNTFIKEYDPRVIFFYCDFNRVTDKNCEIPNMKFIEYTGPNKFYVDNQGYKISSDEEDLEETCMYVIYGAGFKKYQWQKEDIKNNIIFTR